MIFWVNKWRAKSLLFISSYKRVFLARARARVYMYILKLKIRARRKFADGLSVVVPTEIVNEGSRPTRAPCSLEPEWLATIYAKKPICDFGRPGLRGFQEIPRGEA